MTLLGHNPIVRGGTSVCVLKWSVRQLGNDTNDVYFFDGNTDNTCPWKTNPKIHMKKNYINHRSCADAGVKRSEHLMYSIILAFVTVLLKICSLWDPLTPNRDSGERVESWQAVWGQGGQPYLWRSRGHSGWWRAAVEPAHCTCTLPHPLPFAHPRVLECHCSQMPLGDGWKEAD